MIACLLYHCKSVFAQVLILQIDKKLEIGTEDYHCVLDIGRKNGIKI